MRHLLLILALSTQSAFAGWYVGNGGDTIECKASSDNNLNGIYALDYILTLGDRKGDDGLAHVGSWQASSERITKLLTNKAPSLAEAFKEFSKLVYNKDYSQRRVWEPAAFGLTKLDDQRIVSLLPENCRGANGEFQITQAVIRMYEKFAGTNWGHNIYKYSPELLQRLDKEAPVQLSMLMVHEWLWDLSNNVERNRRINRFLHSREIENMSPAEVESTLKGMGFYLPNKQPDAFDPDMWQGYPLTKQQFYARFPKDSNHFTFGKLQIDRRIRDEDCDGDEYCNPGWIKDHMPYLLDDSRSRFFLTASWRLTRDQQFPIKITSPELVSWNRKTLLPGMGEIECRFAEGTDLKDGNLECRFQTINLINPLFNLIDVDRIPVEQRPTMRASMTEDCFRLLVRSTRKIETIRPAHEHKDVKQTIETAFTLRYRWKP